MCRLLPAFPVCRQLISQSLECQGSHVGSMLHDGCNGSMIR
jgi:hypothetical protein